MEIFELKYFLAVAREEHIHRASEKLRVSPPALSKAIARLEDELGKKLFAREGRHIRLTDEGRALQKRALEIVELEETARLEIVGGATSIHAIIAGPELLLSSMGIPLTDQIRARFPSSTFELQIYDEPAALRAVQRGDAHFAIVTSEVPPGLKSRRLSEVIFRTCVGRGHALSESAARRKSVPIDELLKHGFVSPDRPLLGRTRARQALDGWRDDVFPRRIEYVASSLKVLEAALLGGRALAYLPDYYAKSLGVTVLNVTGCPYSCTQTVKLVAPGKKASGWINQIF